MELHLTAIGGIYRITQITTFLITCHHIILCSFAMALPIRSSEAPYKIE